MTERLLLSSVHPHPRVKTAAATVSAVVVLVACTGCTAILNRPSETNEMERVEVRVPSFVLNAIEAMSEAVEMPADRVAGPDIERVEIEYTAENLVPFASNRVQLLLAAAGGADPIEPMVLDSITVGGLRPEVQRKIEVTGRRGVLDFFRTCERFRLGARLTDDIPLANIEIRAITVRFLWSP